MRKAILILLPIPTFVFSIFLGTYHLSFIEIAHLFLNLLLSFEISNDSSSVVLFNIRLPRILLALLVGSALSISGATLQGIFRNPLVSPYILGLSWGAGFGAALSLVFFPFLPTQLLAFVFGIFAVVLAYGLARTQSGTPIISLILAGVVVSALFSALISAVQYLADPHKLTGVVYWMMGGFYLANWNDLAISFPLILTSCILLTLMGWRINVISMGDEEAKSLGINVEIEKGVLIGLATLSASAAVAVSGVIGWVGLIVPHIVRMIVGSDHRILIPSSAAFGATFMLLADDIARTAVTYEIPVGIITTLTGAPFFAYLLKKKVKVAWAS